MGSRCHADCYPTPPDAAEALHRWLRARGWLDTPRTWLDPAAGFGVLLEGLPGPKRGIEVSDQHDLHRELAAVCDLVCRGDAMDPKLDAVWESAEGIPENPPFGGLEPFVARTVRAMQVGRAEIAACLTRVQWLDDGGDRWRRYRPHYILRMPWRQSFTGDGATDSTSHCWLVWEHTAPATATAVEWAPRPAVSDAAWERHRRLSLGVGAAQGELEGLV